LFLQRIREAYQVVYRKKREEKIGVKFDDVDENDFYEDFSEEK
jgi:hypothetical protein